MTGPTSPGTGPQPSPEQQPGYPAPFGYGQPAAMGPETTRMARLDPGPGLAFGVLGTVIAAVGAVLVVLSFTVLDWLTRGSEPDSHFRTIRRVLSRDAVPAAGPAKLYFSWLGWALLVAVVVFALLANLPSPLTNAFRVIGALGAAAAIAVTFVAIKLADGPAYSEYLKHARIGFYVAVGGFLLVGIGALVGPARERR
jgi:hypothetical protein